MQNIPCKFHGNLKSGQAITLDYEDKQRSVPGTNPDGTTYDAITSWIRVRSGSPELLPDEAYVQESVEKGEMCGEPRKLMVGREVALLHCLGVDVSSLKAQSDLGELVLSEWRLLAWPSVSIERPRA